MSEKINHNIEQEINKREIYEKLCDGQPDAFYVLSGGIVKKERGDKPYFKSGSYAEMDQYNLMSGGKGIVVAAAELGGVFKDSKIVSCSFHPKDDKGAPTHARVIAEELKRLGVDEQQIILQEKSNSTFSEMAELVKIIVDNNWHHVAVVAN